MMDLASKFTILIQGPLHPNSVIAIRAYAKKFPVILSTWSDTDENESQISKMIGKNDHVTIVSYNLDEEEDFYDEQSRYKQFLTTYRGLRLVETDYVIKLRSDEYYTDLTPLIEKFLKNKEKLVTSSLFFRKISYYYYHPSDHVYVAKTEKLLKTLKACIDDCKIDPMLIAEKCKAAAKDGSTLSPEQHLAINWILENNELNLNKPGLTADDHKKIMKDNFEVVDVKDLGFYTVSFHGTYVFDADKFFEKDTDIKKLEDL